MKPHLRGVEKKYTAKIKQLGLEVRRLRETRSWTQQELADRSEVDIRTIQRVEKGEFNIRLHVVFALTDAFGIDPGTLLNDKEKAT